MLINLSLHDMNILLIEPEASGHHMALYARFIMREMVHPFDDFAQSSDASSIQVG
jgi:hypothetical protein